VRKGWGLEVDRALSAESEIIFGAGEKRE